MTDNRYCILLILILLSLASCSVDRDPCLLPKNTSLRIGTYQNNDTSAIISDTFLPKPIWFAVDSPIGIQFPDRTAKFSLLLASITDSCRYAIQPDSAIVSFDTLTFYYDRKLQFLSNACGYTYYFNLKRVRTTFNNIDSVKLTNTEVNSNANSQEHVQIFF